MQIVAPAFEEARIYQVAAAYEAATDWRLRHPTLNTN
jgi:Asp-tRNA(Asn)/Glu-tRNA(Gln) amidotransferase A subunit family amidase